MLFKETVNFVLLNCYNMKIALGKKHFLSKICFLELYSSTDLKYLFRLLVPFLILKIASSSNRVLPAGLNVFLLCADVMKCLF